MSHRHRILRFWLAAAVMFCVLEGTARLAASTMEEPLRWYDASAELKITQMGSVGQVDVLIAGSSMPWQGFIPEIFAEAGVVAYNASLAGAVPPVTQRWLSEEAVPRLNPQTVIWGLSSLDFAPRYGDENLERYEEALATTPGLLADVERLVSSRLRLVSHRTQLRDPSVLFGAGDTELVANREKARDTVFPLGDRAGYEANTSPELAAVQRARLAEFAISDTDSKVIEETIEWLTERNIRVVLVEMPVPDRFIELHPDSVASYDLVEREIARLGDVTGVEVLDTSDWFADEGFEDFTHLKRDRAVILSQAVASYLSSGELIAPDTRSAFEDNQEDGGDVPPDVCEERIVEDEYGNDIDVLVCPEGVETPADPDTLIIKDADVRVLQGDDGWLFYAYSVQQICQTSEARDGWGAEVELSRRILESVGKDLVVAIIPDRGIVADEHLGSLENDCQVNNHELIVSLADQHPSVISLHSVLDEAKKVRVADTHWSPQGAMAGARALANAIDPLAWDDTLIGPVATFEHLSDLVIFDGGTETEMIEYNVLDIAGTETTRTSTDFGLPLYTTTNPNGSDRRVLLLHDSNGGYDDVVGLGGYYFRPWFSSSSSLQVGGGEIGEIWTEPAQGQFADADVVAVMFIQRSVTSWINPGRLSVSLVTAVADQVERVQQATPSSSFPAQESDGVLIISDVSAPEDVDVVAQGGRVGHRVDGASSSAMYVSAGTELTFSKPVAAAFVPLDQFD